jgi:prepilin signal peptidase PulO-like enzyme (type II secretory pathway)
MTVAALIDADETIIPDSIIIPGTLIGLAFAAIFPQSLLPNAYQIVPGRWILDPLWLSSPNSWPVGLNPPGIHGLLCGVACWLLWCFALLPRTWYSRHGARRALSLCLARIRRDQFSLLIAGFAVVGGAAIVIGWHLGGLHWQGLLTALVGMAGGAAVIWAVRIVGSAAMKREAMGFGDVTLMAMIGAFLGWQATLVVFFLAPFAALAYGLSRLLFSRQREIAYGPFLCPAALAAIIFWEPIWDRTWHVFALGWLVPVIIAACVPLIPLMLYGLRLLREGFGGE